MESEARTDRRHRRHGSPLDPERRISTDPV